MNTKVKISYTVDLDSVPAEAANLVSRASDILATVVEDIKKIEELKDNSVHKTIKHIDDIRMKIYEMDLYFSDSANMYMGYLHAISTPQEEQAHHPQTQRQGQPAQQERAIE